MAGQMGKSGTGSHTHGGYRHPHIKPSHEGRLHERLGVPEGQDIPEDKLQGALHSDDPSLRKQAQFAENAKHWDHNK